MTETTSTVQRFRKVPVVIEAMRFERDPAPVIEWINSESDGDIAREGGRDEHGPLVIIETLEGPMFARRGDWVIRGVAGEFSPCKPEIFDVTYEAVKEGFTLTKEEDDGE